MGIRVECSASDVQLGNISADWRALLTDCSTNSLFLTPEWLCTWWRYFGGASELFVLCAWDSSAGLIGVAPFRITRRSFGGGLALRVIEFLGTDTPVWSDDMDFVLKRGMEDQVCAAFGEYLQSVQNEWDLALLTDISASSSTLTHTSKLFGSGRLRCSVKQEAVCPYLSLGDSWDVYDDRAHRKFRDLKKYFKALAQAGAEFGVVENEDELEKALEALIQLNQKRIERKGDVPSLSVPTFGTFVKEFCRIALRLGWLRLYYISVNKEFIALNLNFVFSNRAYGYLGGSDPLWQRHGVGTCLFWHTIRESWRSGLGVYDFLRGDEAYKYRWTSEERKTLSVKAVNHPVKYSAYRAAIFAQRAFTKIRRTCAFSSPSPTRELPSRH